jgi:predicted RNA binding protein YcfA (HicA-like mRNA interferase family)
VPRLPRITGPELLRALERAGWRRVVQVGSHVQLRRPDGTGRVTIPVHAGKTVKQGTLNSILKQAGLTRDELANLL